MKTIDCRRVCQEIEEADRLQLQQVSLAARGHIESCVQCKVFLDQRLKLQEIVSSLATVETPADFDFQLRARLARGEGLSFRKIGGLWFSFSSIAVAMLALLVGAGLLTRVFLPNSAKGPTETPQASVAATKGKQVNTTPPDTKPKVVQVKQQSETAASEIAPSTVIVRGGSQKTGLANGRTKSTLVTKEFSSLPAPVFRSDQSVASAVTFPVFPIAASYQSLKVSLDDGSGISRTISVPTVSFGSQRVLASSPVTSSSKGDW